jgi:hypothetical protein
MRKISSDSHLLQYAPFSSVPTFKYILIKYSSRDPVPLTPFLVQACQSWRGGASDPNPRPKTANQFPHPSSFSAVCTWTLMVPSIFIQKKLAQLKKILFERSQAKGTTTILQYSVTCWWDFKCIIAQWERREGEGPPVRTSEICRGLKLYREKQLLMFWSVLPLLYCLFSG